MNEEYAIGVDLGATNVRVAVGDRNGHILKKLYEKTDIHHGPEGIPAQINRMIHDLQKEFKLIFKGVGIGSIGPMDPKKGVIRAPNIPFTSVPLTEPVRREFNVTVTLLNDCNAAVVGEKEFGAGRGLDDVAYITLSTGIGGGVYANGCLLLGKDGNASHVGHVVIDVEGRLECGCGRRGHWEAYCSGRNIPNYVRMLLEEREDRDSSLMRRVEGDSYKITAQILFEEARKGDKLSLSIVDSVGRLNAIGFANVINAYDPSIIVVGGALALNHEDLIMKPIERYVNDYAVNRIPELTVTKLGEDVVLLGAIASVQKDIAST